MDLSGIFQAIGAWSVRRRWLVLGLWAVIVLVAGWYGQFLPQLMKGNVGLLEGTESYRAEKLINDRFDAPLAQFVVVTVERHDAPSEPLPQVVDRLQSRFRQLPVVTALLPVPGSDVERAAFLVGVHSSGLADTERHVPEFRQVLAQTVPETSGYRARLTGEAPLDIDLIALATHETRRAEFLVLPFSLLALLIAFGTLGAAVAPLVAGAGAVILALGALAFVAKLTPLAIFAANVASMLGLGLGIDYALFVVARIREEAQGHDAPTPAHVVAAIRHAAPAIAVSAATVLIGLAALMTVPGHDTFGLGIGGAIVAATAALSGMTLLPALAATLGPWLDRPRLLTRRFHGAAQIRFWERQARRIVHRPLLSLGLAVVLLSLLAWPATWIRLGDPDVAFFPESMPSIQGLKTLERMEARGLLTPFRLVVTVPDGDQVLSLLHLPGLARMTALLREDPRVAQVIALADPQQGLDQLVSAVAFMGPYAVQRQLPAAAQTLISREGAATLVTVVLKNDVTYQQAREFGWDLKKVPWQTLPGLENADVAVGGLIAANTDYIDIIRSYFPQVVLIVLAATLVMLHLMTRSWLIPVKAVLANLLTVAAALGGTALLVQTSFGASLLGLPGPVESFSPAVPILTFCIVFGLSMDYEVFLISRIFEAHQAGDDDRAAVIHGIGRSGSVITSAAVIMGIVFVGFALTDLLPIKMLGIALALGVLLDATVTRLVLIPSLMMIAGRWNWWPGTWLDATRRNAGRPPGGDA